MALLKRHVAGIWQPGHAPQDDRVSHAVAKDTPVELREALMRTMLLGASVALACQCS